MCQSMNWLASVMPTACAAFTLLEYKDYIRLRLRLRIRLHGVTFSQIVRLIGLWLVLASQQQIHKLNNKKEKLLSYCKRKSATAWARTGSVRYGRFTEKSPANWLNKWAYLRLRAHKPTSLGEFGIQLKHSGYGSWSNLAAAQVQTQQ